MHRKRTRERERERERERGTSKLLELVPNPFDDNNKICSKQRESIICSYAQITRRYKYRVKNDCRI